MRFAIVEEEDFVVNATYTLETSAVSPAASTVVSHLAKHIVNPLHDHLSSWVEGQRMVTTHMKDGVSTTYCFRFGATL